MILSVTHRPVHAAPSPPRRMLCLCPTSCSAPVVASAKRLRRRRRSTPVEDDGFASVDEETPDAGRAERSFLAALGSQPAQPKQDGQSRGPRPPQPPPSPSSDSGRRASLSGLDVLQALQRKAAAGRKGGIGGGKGGRGPRRVAKSSGGGGEEQLAVRDYSNVRPLDIKSDWATRLDELDKLIQELQAQQLHYSD